MSEAKPMTVHRRMEIYMGGEDKFLTPAQRRRWEKKLRSGLKKGKFKIGESESTETTVAQ